MVRAVVELDAHVVDRIAGQDAARERFLDALVDRLDVLARNRAADRLVLELVAGAGRQRNEANLGVAVLAAAAGLAHEPAIAFGRLR